LPAVQLREKDLPGRDLFELARALRDRTRASGARLLVNDRADVAVAVGADGVQRTHASLPVAALRQLIGDALLIGASVHSVAEALDAEAQGADFLVFGPVYDTPSKRAYGPPQGLVALERVVAAVARPVLAVGGITPERVRETRRAGAHGVAVITAILAADRPGDAVKTFLDALADAA
jgi:thiamine-phosphate pyrophosphorylase